MRAPALIAIFLIVVVDVLAFTLIIPLLPFYAERFGATPAQVGALVATFSACQLVAGPVLGNLSDRVGRKPVLFASQLGTFAGFVVLAKASALWMVFLARLVDGVTAGNLTVAQAAIADVTPPEQRTRAFAIIGVSFGLGFLIGPAASAWLATRDPVLPVWCAAGLSAVSALLTLLLLPKPTQRMPPQRGSFRGEQSPEPDTDRRLGVFDWGAYAPFLRRPDLRGRFTQFFLFAFAFAVFTSGFALFAERRLHTGDGRPFGVREVGYALAYSGLLGVLLQGGLVGRVAARVGDARLVSVSFIVQAAGFAVLAFTRDLPSLLLSATLVAFGNAPLRAGLMSLITRRVGSGEQGLALGLTQSLAAVAQVGAPLVAGALIGRGWLTAWALLAAGLSAAAVAWGDYAEDDAVTRTRS